MLLGYGGFYLQRKLLVAFVVFICRAAAVAQGEASVDLSAGAPTAATC